MMKEAALISKAVRNEGLRLIPNDIVEEAMQIARETLRTRDKKDPEGAKKAVLDAFATLNIGVGDVETFLGHSTERIAATELEELRMMYAAISTGDAKWEDYTMPPADDDDKQGRSEEVAGKLKDDMPNIDMNKYPGSKD